jgi:hypothetical protein
MVFRAEISRDPAGRPCIYLSDEVAQEAERVGATQIEGRMLDPRCHSHDQHGKVFALCEEISKWSGHGKTDLVLWEWVCPKEARHWLTDDFCARKRIAKFSMSDVDVTTCKKFISYLVKFCLIHDVPTRYPLGQYAEDIKEYLYACLWQRKCALCGIEADIHHVDTVGVGRDRRTVNHVGMRIIPLCRDHHGEAHWRGVKSFFERYHLPNGVKCTEKLAKHLNLNTNGD